MAFTPSQKKKVEEIKAIATLVGVDFWNMENERDNDVRRAMLHPIGAAPAGHDDPRRKAVPMRQRFAIHFIGDECRVLDSFPYRKAFCEIRSLVDGRPISAVEDDFDRVLLESNHVDHILEPSAFPARAADRAIAPLDASDMGLKKSTRPVRGRTREKNFNGRNC